MAEELLRDAVRVKVPHDDHAVCAAAGEQVAAPVEGADGDVISDGQSIFDALGQRCLDLGEVEEREVLSKGWRGDMR